MLRASMRACAQACTCASWRVSTQLKMLHATPLHRHTPLHAGANMAESWQQCMSLQHAETAATTRSREIRLCRSPLPPFLAHTRHHRRFVLAHFQPAPDASPARTSVIRGSCAPWSAWPRRLRPGRSRSSRTAGCRGPVPCAPPRTSTGVRGRRAARHGPDSESRCAELTHAPDVDWGPSPLGAWERPRRAAHNSPASAAFTSQLSIPSQYPAFPSPYHHLHHPSPYPQN